MSHELHAFQLLVLFMKNVGRMISSQMFMNLTVPTSLLSSNSSLSAIRDY